MTPVEFVQAGDVLQLKRREVQVDVAAEYQEIGVRSFGRGIFHKEPVDGASLGSKRVFRIEPGDLVISNVFAWEGAVAVASEAEEGKIGSHRFMTFVSPDGRVDTTWASWFFRSEPGLKLIREASPGSAGRNRTLAVNRFEELTIPLPAIDEQRRVALRIGRAVEMAARVAERIARAETLARAAQVSLVSAEPGRSIADSWVETQLGDVVAPSKARQHVNQAHEYPIAGVYSFGKGLIDRGLISGAETSYTALTRLHEGDIVISKLNGWEGAVAVVNRDFDGMYVSSEFPTFGIDTTRMLPGFFRGIARSPMFWAQLNRAVRGSMVRRRRISANDFARTVVALPDIDAQARISGLIDRLDGAIERSARSSQRASALAQALLNREFAALV